MNTIEIILSCLVAVCMIDNILMRRTFNHNMKAIEGKFDATKKVIDGLGKIISQLNEKVGKQEKVLREMGGWLSSMQGQISDSKNEK